MIAGALQEVVQAARDGEQEDPPIEAPAELRPYLAFRSLPPAALEATRRAAEADSDLRGRAGRRVPTDLDEASRLWLLRPDGWEQALRRLAVRLEEQEEVDRAHRRAEDLVREVERAESRLAELDRLARSAADEANETRESLAEERSRRRAATDELSVAVGRLDRLEATVEEHRRRADQAEAALEVRERELGESNQRRQELEGELAARPPVPEDQPRQVAADSVRRRLSRVRRAADELGDAVADVEQLVPTEPDPIAPPAHDRARTRRQPAPIPKGLSGDSVEAARHLIGLPDAVLLVDGYNASMLAWGSEPIPEQRRRLEAGLELVAARTGVAPLVVYDGEDGGTEPTATPRQAVRARFSPSSVEADDVVLALIAEFPPSRPVIVVSNDRRVRDGAVERGANVLSSTRLVDLIQA